MKKYLWILLFVCLGLNTAAARPRRTITTTTTTTTLPAGTVSWTQCSGEGGVCAFSGTRDVRYGINGVYFTKTATSSINCDNATFGDPAPGYFKYCSYSSVVQSAPVTTTTLPVTTTTLPSSSALVTDSVFAPTSFWYTPIPATAPLDPNSANLVKDFLRQKAAYYGTVTINTDGYSSPVYVAPANAPTVAVGFNDCQGKGYFDSSLQQQWAAVPIPSYALPAPGTDQEMTIYQPSTDTIWEFWVTWKTNGQWQACWGGRMQNASKTQGIWTNPYGTTATGLPFLGGQITAEELQRGEIRHAIGIALVDTAAWNVVSWPATRSDGNGWGIIAEGQRFRLDPTLNVEALAVSRTAKIIARAAQKYGFVVWDKAGAISLRAQNIISYTALGSADPYHPTLFEGMADWQVLSGFPWDRLQFLPMNYGQP